MSSWIRLMATPKITRHLLYGIIIGFSLSLSSTSLALYYQSRRNRSTVRFDPRPIELRSDEILPGVTGLIGMMQCLFKLYFSTSCVLRKGNTPLIRINSLSDALGVEI